MARDENETAFSAIQAATDEATGPEILAEIVGELREGIEAGTSDAELALILWPRLARVIETVNAETNAEIIEGLAKWREARNPAAELGRKGGKKGGKARAEKLSPEQRSEIAKKAARARWARDE